MTSAAQRLFRSHPGSTGASEDLFAQNFNAGFLDPGLHVVGSTDDLAGALAVLRDGLDSTWIEVIGGGNEMGFNPYNFTVPVLAAGRQIPSFSAIFRAGLVGYDHGQAEVNNLIINPDIAQFPGLVANDNAMPTDGSPRRFVVGPFTPTTSPPSGEWAPAAFTNCFLDMFFRVQSGVVGTPRIYDFRLRVNFD